LPALNFWLITNRCAGPPPKPKVAGSNPAGGTRVFVRTYDDCLTSENEALIQNVIQNFPSVAS